MNTTPFVNLEEYKILLRFSKVVEEIDNDAKKGECKENRQAAAKLVLR